MTPATQGSDRRSEHTVYLNWIEWCPNPVPIVDSMPFRFAAAIKLHGRMDLGHTVYVDQVIGGRGRYISVRLGDLGVFDGKLAFDCATSPGIYRD